MAVGAEKHAQARTWVEFRSFRGAPFRAAGSKRRAATLTKRRPLSMRGLLAVVAGLAAVVSVTANCPNACSGHGDCSTNHDFCSCYAGFIGADCSERAL